ncbi:kinesin-like protein KIF16B [Physella acuta]|uniref:kinesin-like protein KIF16B n=1 Tax=Physella acuta TaxID=109671 RepID=UPI0027DBFCF4|nr:kinesin-like protein KIF16B [Physella acuta]XP_059148243.1 kinesin-like protein KIF16B [Physella acuta]XP_059148245.1 kinesin-like protein KIF16B [Physella acuta]XP_059148246.1 kinesin-like protein KIF16B [Physella acuta]XP_059148247.1 kinesin-like protein KIF16B [Physella acuta]
MTSVKVIVRVRPLNCREDGLSSQIIIQMDGNKTRIINPKAPSHASEGDGSQLKVREFTFDHSFWSVDANDLHYVNQEQVFSSIGEDVVQSAFDGYNVCIFAYGQTGSGKTYTMMGSEEDPGLVPRYCNALFSRLRDNHSDSFQIYVSYLEIYNEKVRDLLKSASSSKHNLRVREHPRDGPYVQDLSKHSVASYDVLMNLMKRGNLNRTTASTNMNDVSSRSHAIFTITFTQARFLDGLPSERQSKINLVDLAGSERADSSGATGLRLKEGGSINKSLVSLGNVISLLAERSENGVKSKPMFIPYRDSVLTWLLKDSLGGNAKTVMIATVSPADVNYGETLSTLRYANRAKNIINRPTVNEDPNVKLIRELREEIARLRALLEGSGDSSPRVQEKLHENEARVKVLTEEWAEKWNESASLMREQKLALRQTGVGVILDSKLPHLVAIDEDLLSTGVKLYHLKEGLTKLGSCQSDEPQDITLSDEGIEAEHCVIEHRDQEVVLHPIEGARCAINNHLLTQPTRLQQGMVITLGEKTIFRFNHPEQAKLMKKNLQIQKSLSSTSLVEDRKLSCSSLTEDRKLSARLTLLSQSMTDLYRSNESLALSGNDITACREDQEEIEQKRTEIEHLEQQYVRREDERREDERQVQEELEEKRRRLEEIQGELCQSQSKPCVNIEERLAQLDQQEDELLEDLKISKDNLLKELESVSWYPDQLTEEDSISQVVRDLERQLAQTDQAMALAEQRKSKLHQDKDQLSQELGQVMDHRQQLAARWDTERRSLASSCPLVSQELERFEREKAELAAQQAQVEASSKWQEVLENLQEQNRHIEEAWADLTEQETRCHMALQLGNFSSAEEKLEMFGELQQLREARQLLELEEKSFVELQQQEMAAVEQEVEAWEQVKVRQLGQLQAEEEKFLLDQSHQLRCLAQDLKAADLRQQQLQQALAQLSTPGTLEGDVDLHLKDLSEQRSRLLEEKVIMEKRCDEKKLNRKEKMQELEVEIETLEEMYHKNLEEIKEEKRKLVLYGNQQDSSCATDNRQQELEMMREELEGTVQVLEEKLKAFHQERDSQLDQIEFEKLKLLEMERQDRLNSLVEQEVKCRLFEEKVERERLRKLERERDKQEREREIERLKSLHQREMSLLRAQLEFSATKSAELRVTRSQSCETVATHDRKTLVRQMSCAVDKQSMLSIEIPTFVLRGSGRDLHYEYLVKVSVGNEAWYVFRRYSRFREMHSALKKKYPSVNQLIFPPRKFFHKNKKVALERRTLLEQYVRHAVELCMRIPECPLHPSQNKELTKQVLVDFEPFFRRGLFETARNLTT